MKYARPAKRDGTSSAAIGVAVISAALAIGAEMVHLDLGWRGVGDSNFPRINNASKRPAIEGGIGPGR